MNGFKCCAMVFFGVCLVCKIHAADFNDPNWPCVQRKVETLSIGQMWTHEISETASLDEDAQSLINILSLRRVDLEEAEHYVDDYAKAHPDADAAHYSTIFAEILKGTNKQRSEIIQGIGRYAQGQQARAEKIDALRLQMNEEEAKDSPDYDRLDALERDIDWDERIHKDRERALSYVCETPVILEKRLYALAQILSAQIE